MKKFLISFALFACMAMTANAQDYNTGVGLRGGFTSGLTVKHFLSSNTAVEGILSTRWRGFDITGLYEIHNQAFNVPGLNWYYGFGGHIGFWNGKHVSWGSDNSYTVIGIDGILGLEYSFTEIPFNISIDWKPMLNVIGYSGFWGDGGAISLRYIF